MKTGNIKFEGKEYTIYSTSDYGIFKYIKENRNSSQLSEGLTPHATKIKESIKVVYLFSLVIVNEKMQIIDGQNRVAALRELGLKVYYIIIPGYNGKELQRLNQYSSNWALKDYLNYYATQGVRPYVQMSEFWKHHPFFAITTIMSILSNQVNIRSAATFKNGDFKVTVKDLNKLSADLKLVEEICDVIYTSEGGTVHRDLALAALKVVNHPNYNHKGMLAAIEKNSAFITAARANVSAYTIAFSNTYNYQRALKYRIEFHTNADLNSVAGVKSLKKNAA